MLSVENNLEDLRKIFKEADFDCSGYLNKQELR
jgi:Ca2+-binding EF-hand superfamily protein